MKNLKFLTSIFIMLMPIFTSCSYMLATRNIFDKLNREVEATEEELEDAELSAIKRKKILKSQMNKIKNIQREREIFEAAMKRISDAVLEETDEQIKTENRILIRMEELKNQIHTVYYKYSIAKKTFNETWTKKIKSIQNLVCPKYKNQMNICVNYSNSSLNENPPTN